MGKFSSYFKEPPDEKFYFSSAFFEGQVEQPVRGLTSLITHQDIPVLVGINSKGVYVIDDIECVRDFNRNFSKLLMLVIERFRHYF